jgi:hypothetical protein
MEETEFERVRFSENWWRYSYRMHPMVHYARAIILVQDV